MVRRLPLPVARFGIAVLSEGGFNCHWDPQGDGYDGFRVEYRVSGDTAWSLLGIVDADTNAIALTDGVPENTAYDFRVCSFNDNGASAYVVCLAIVSMLYRPTIAPAEVLGPNSVKITWANNTLVTPTEIRITYGALVGGLEVETDLSEILAADATECTITGLTEGVEYAFAVLIYYPSFAAAYNHPPGTNHGRSAYVYATPHALEPAPPTNLIASAISQTHINTFWTDNSDNETGFSLEISTDGETWTVAATTDADENSASVTGLVSDTEYFFRVRAVNAVGYSAYSNTASAATAEALPTVPDNFIGIAVSSTSNALDWDQSQNATCYELQQKSGTGNWESLDPIPLNVTQAQITELTKGTEYQYRIRACKVQEGQDTVYSDWSETITVTTLALTEPSNLVATTGGPGLVYLTWQGNDPAATHYEIRRVDVDESEEQGPLGRVAVPGTAFEDDGINHDFAYGIEPSTQYTYYVIAKQYQYESETGWDFDIELATSGPSGVASATTQAAGTPNAPTGLAATMLSHKSVRLDWQDRANNETGFKVERHRTTATGAVFDWAQIATRAANAKTYTSVLLYPDYIYRYRVRAANAAGDSVYSNTVQIVTMFEPTNLTATAVAYNRIDLTWLCDSNRETGFSVERSLNGSTGWEEIATPAANATSYSDTTCQPGTRYYYRVRASNSYGYSDYSGTANATTDLAEPSNLVAETGGPDLIYLTWQGNDPEATHYEIHRVDVDESEMPGPLGRVAVSETAFEDDGVGYDFEYGIDPSTEYTYYVIAKQYQYESETGWDFDTELATSGRSSNATATTQAAGTPRAPRNLAGTLTAATTVHLTWQDKSNNETGFILQRNPYDSGWSQLGTPAADATSQNNFSLQAARKYQYRICSTNAAGDSVWSNVATVYTPCAAPGSPSATKQGSTQIDVAWSAVTRATGYKVERSLNGTSGWSEVGDVATTSFSDTTCEPNTQYFYRVAGYWASAGGVWSSVVNATTEPQTLLSDEFEVREGPTNARSGPELGTADTGQTWLFPSVWTTPPLQIDEDGNAIAVTGTWELEEPEVIQRIAWTAGNAADGQLDFENIEWMWNGLNGSGSVGLVCRLADADNYILFRYFNELVELGDGMAIGTSWELVKVIEGVGTRVDYGPKVTVAGETMHTLTLIFNDTTITGKLDGNTITTQTINDSALQTGTGWGFHLADYELEGESEE